MAKKLLALAFAICLQWATGASLPAHTGVETKSVPVKRGDTLIINNDHGSIVKVRFTELQQVTGAVTSTKPGVVPDVPGKIQKNALVFPIRWGNFVIKLRLSRLAGHGFWAHSYFIAAMATSLIRPVLNAFSKGVALQRLLHRQPTPGA
jgi:hypothetical protein